MKSTKLSGPYLLGLFCCYAVASGFSIWDIICLHCGRWTYISTSTLAVLHTSTVYTCTGSGAQLCPTLCIPVDDYSPPGSCVHGVIQARILEWVAISSCRGSSPPRDGTGVSCGSCIGRCTLSHCATWECLVSSRRQLQHPWRGRWAEQEDQ